MIFNWLSNSTIPFAPKSTIAFLFTFEVSFKVTIKRDKLISVSKILSFHPRYSTSLFNSKLTSFLLILITANSIISIIAIIMIY